MRRRSEAKTRRLVLATALAIVLSAGGCTSSAERASELGLQAEQQFQAGDLANARLSALEAVGERDDIPQLWSLLGRIEVAAGSYGAAFNAYSRANELDRGNLEALQIVAEISFLAGQYTETERFADQLLALNPQNLRAQLLKGGVAQRRQRHVEALEIAESVLEVEPASEEARVLKAQALDELDRGPEAIVFLERELELRGDTVASLQTLKTLQLKAGDQDAVLDIAQRQVALQPESLDRQLDYARELLRRGRDAPALAHVDGLRLRQRDSRALLSAIVDLWIATGRDPVGRDAMLAMARDGTEAERLAMARYANHVGQPADAIDILSAARGPETINPYNVEAQILIAAAEADLGRTDVARRRIERIYTFDPTNPRGLSVRTRLLTQAGALDQALNDAQVLVRDSPTSAEARILLAEVYIRRNDLRLADSRLREGMRALPDSAQLAEYYADFLFEQGRPGDAIRVGRDYTRGNPADPRGWRLRAGLCGRVGDTACVAEARAQLQAIDGGTRAG